MDVPCQRSIKTGQLITIRPAIPQDAAALLSLKKSYIRNTSTIPLFEDEYPDDEVLETALIDRYIAEKNSLLLVAEFEGMLIGNIDLTGSKRRKLFHTAMLGMGVAYDWQGKGVGYCLVESLLQNVPSPINIIWLEIYGSNTGGIKLYENAGFEPCGIMKDFFNEGGTIDKITMIKYIKQHA